MVSKRKLKIKAVEYLEKNRLMALGTCLRDKPWTATVFFAYDKKLNLYFYSREDTLHCRHIKKNPHVAVTMNHAWKDRQGKIRGLQITGKASKVPYHNYRKFYTLYKSRFKWADAFTADHVLYAIKPSEVWYIDEKLFGHFYRVRVI